MANLLLADDDESIAMVARLGLRRAGYAVTIVDDGAKALAEARRTPYDAIILDWFLPEMDGIDVCRALVDDPDWPKVPIVFLTGATHDGAEAEAIAAGAKGVVFKPFDPMTVGERVKAIIG